MWKITICLLGLLGLASAARVQEAMLRAQDPLTTGGNIKSVLTLLREHDSNKRDDKGDKAGYVSIKFFVPPSEADDFEEAWGRLEDETEKEEDVDHFSLKKTMLDNFLYFSYGEWKSMRHVRDHFESDHFDKFSKFVDDHGIRWELRLLENLSEEVEKEEEGRRKERGLSFHKDNAHILAAYDVPPGEGEGFVDAWTDAAEKTIKEKGNIVYSLRKVVGDNTRFWIYGSWDRMSDWLDHLESRHLGKLFDYVADRKIIYTTFVLEDIEDEDEKTKTRA
jgi:quinol monooxygenase YgiN